MRHKDRGWKKTGCTFFVWSPWNKAPSEERCSTVYSEKEYCEKELLSNDWRNWPHSFQTGSNAMVCRCMHLQFGRVSRDSPHKHLQTKRNDSDCSTQYGEFRSKTDSGEETSSPPFLSKKTVLLTINMHGQFLLIQQIIHLEKCSMTSTLKSWKCLLRQLERLPVKTVQTFSE